MGNSYRHGGWKHSKARTILQKFSGQTAKNVVLVAVALFIAGTIGLLGVFAFISRDLPDPNSLMERKVEQSTKIFDRTGEHLLYEIFADENRTLVKPQEGFCETQSDTLEIQEDGIPLYAIQATIAAEDRKFCEHHGFDIIGIGRAVVQNVRGNRVGGSTLTQQLVKNAILSSEKTVTRKVKELILAVELERRYSKDQILQIYFNEIPYGSTYYGIQSASEHYYDKPVHELSLAEAATLAALPKAPTRYLNNPDLLKERRDWILQGMADLGYITQQEADDAMRDETDVDVDITDIQAPHFVFHVKQLLEEKYGQQQVETDGLKVITTLDYDKQKIAEEVVEQYVNENAEALGFSNAALVATDPKTGQVLTMVGSKDYFDDDIDGQVNVALRNRQPGSSFKPIVYTKGFEMGYTPQTVLWDVKTRFPTASGTYSPNNYDLGQRGPVRVRKALQGSLNIPAVKMLYLVGVGNAIDFAESLGYSTFTNRDNFGLAIVLGGAEVKLLEHVNAYGAFANQGAYHDSVSVLRVEDSNGNVLEEWEESEGKRVMNENVANMITNILSDNASRAYAFGLNSNLQLGNRPVAAKTGTTNDYHDAWTIGYTPSLAAGVWGGNNDNSEMFRGSGGSSVAAPIWNEFMRRALEDQPIERFASPRIPQTGKDVLDGRMKSETVMIDKASGKLATEYTPPSYRVEETFAEYHNILHYVDRSDPLGAPPENPEQDPYYEPWETAVQAWIEAQEKKTGVEISSKEPPTEFDDLHVPENFPRLKIESPNENETINSRTLTVDIRAEATRGVRRVEYYLDGFFIASTNTEPFDATIAIPNTVSSGYHTLKVVAYDDIENSGSDTVGVRITQDVASNGIEIIDPKNGQTIEPTKEEFNVVLSVQNPDRFRSLTLYAQPIGPGQRYVVGTVLDPTNPFITFSWSLPEAGDWVLFASGQREEDGEYVNTAGSVVHVGTRADSSDEETGEGEEQEEETQEPATELNPFANLPPAPEPEPEETEEEETDPSTEGEE